MFTIIKASSLPLQQNLIKHFFKSVTAVTYPKLAVCAGPIQGRRTFFSKYALGIEGFLIQGADLRAEIGNSKESFIQRMQDLQQTSGTEKNVSVYIDDLKNLMALCQEDIGYLDLVIVLLKKYYHQHNQNKHRVSFHFGPPLMRLLHFYDLPEKAVEVMMDEEFGAVLKNSSSYQITMDLLYEKGLYEDVIKLMKTMQFFPTTCIILATAANYKISTDEALEYSLELIRKSSELRLTPIKMLTFVAGLALKRGKPEIALEVCSRAPSIHHFVVNNIYVLANARMGKLDEVIHMLDSKTLLNLPPKISSGESTKAKVMFTPDVIEETERLLNEAQTLELIDDFNRLKETLVDTHLIGTETLDDAICSPILYDRVDGERQHRLQLEKYDKRKSFHPSAAWKINRHLMNQ